MSDLRILAVDESSTMRRIIINTLKRAGFVNVIEASDGKEALAKLETEDINFVITEWNMPEMDGLTLVSNMRKSDSHSKTPVLMVTTRSVKEDVVEALKAGVNNYILKPFTPDTLKEKIEKTLAG